MLKLWLLLLHTLPIHQVHELLVPVGLSLLGMSSSSSSSSRQLVSIFQGQTIKVLNPLVLLVLMLLRAMLSMRVDGSCPGKLIMESCPWSSSATEVLKFLVE